MITYNKNYVAEYRAKAVTSLDDFIVGRTYYGRMSAEPFVLVKILTQREHYKNVDLEGKEGDNPDELCWFAADVGSVESLSDANIGGSYNPWLIFADEATAKEYYDGLKIGYDLESYDDWDDIYNSDIEMEWEKDK